MTLMKTLKIRQCKGYTLVEVIVVIVILSLSLSAFCGILSSNQKTKANAAAREQAITYAHNKCLAFAEGRVYQDLSLLANGQSTTAVVMPIPVSPIPGDEAVLTHEDDIITKTPDGALATLKVIVSYSNTNVSTATVSAFGYRPL